ncbi:helix-turn-helix transcriptional regulator [Anaerobranca gottschalkii]|uniref:Tetratricopeptide repeat-containing protein n=1 Tax=Anaerobranca gottschalkii DSM 13577 TaxID=1120990 RepID=A0A1I0C3F9_9FIRM|nr:helix-turn-helix transcriptional regulator [Anaerobranca gottschalkii]SET13946.1 Tetratricopeptide repeat-containing protein [Anaerobranca gottschalkii DSM 13577]
MAYNLFSFGKAVRSIRKQHKISQKTLALETGLNLCTIRKMESGEIIPPFEALDKLSKFFKQDIYLILSSFSIDDNTLYQKTIDKIDSIIDKNDYIGLELEINSLLNLLTVIKTSYHKSLVNQLIFFIKGLICYNKKEYQEALINFVKAISITTDNFDLDKFRNFYYSSMEIRILMNIAFIYHNINEGDKYLEIMLFCFDKLKDKKDPLFPKICHNLATAFKRKKDYKNALNYYDLGIRYCQEQKEYVGLSILYYGKGVTQYYLNDKHYVSSFNIAVSLCEGYNQLYFKDKIIRNCQNYFNCKYSPEFNCFKLAETPHT